jgi:phenol 2-monooxygenase
MVIPRERIATGEYLTRLYVHVQDEVKPDSDIAVEEGIEGVRKSEAKARREKITLESILEQAQEVLKPYYIKPISEDAVDWWAAYQIGQRVSERFVKQDSKGVNRVFIVGDGKRQSRNRGGLLTASSMSHTQPQSWPRNECLNVKNLFSLPHTQSSYSHWSGGRFILPTRSLLPKEIFC